MSTSDVGSAMQLSVSLAVQVLAGADAAAISVVHRDGTVLTPAASDEIVRSTELLQGEAGQGPCLSAAWDGDVIHVVDVRDDKRWPAWSRTMRERSGYRSLLVGRVFRASDRVAALSLYSTRPRAFDRDDLERAATLVAHVAIAVRSSQEVDDLRFALENRTVLGQATGIVMERYGITAEQARSVLSRLSSVSNRKMRDLAEELTATRVTSGLPLPDAHDPDGGARPA